uniref:LysM domain-containing protein n=1 Tax=Cannabis sativa TaxID=3483 RepID=A0A803P3R8_CANSA
MADRVSLYCALLLAVLLVMSCCESRESEFAPLKHINNHKICDEIYVVREGETLQTISERCGDPYIVEENPHIHDLDDIYPGLVIKVTPFRDRCDAIAEDHRVGRGPPSPADSSRTTRASVVIDNHHRAVDLNQLH